MSKVSSRPKKASKHTGKSQARLKDGHVNLRKKLDNLEKQIKDRGTTVAAVKSKQGHLEWDGDHLL